jgi:hypothetical protein
MRSVNLASKPFVNRRPVVRTATLLWVLAGATIALGLWLYGDFFRATQVHRQTLADLERGIGDERTKIETAVARLGALQLDDKNVKALYLNTLIQQRTFPWNRLFDDLESVLPKDVMLVSVAPDLQAGEKKLKERNARGTSRAASRAIPTPAARTGAARVTSRTQRQAPPRQRAKIPTETPTREVLLSLAGMSRTDDALLDFVDILFAHQAFSSPLLANQTRDGQTGLIAFNIEVTYLIDVVLDVPFVLPPSLGGVERVAAGAEAADGGSGQETLAQSVGAGQLPGAAGRQLGQPPGVVGSPNPALGGKTRRGPAGAAGATTAPGFDSASPPGGGPRGRAGRGSAAAGDPNAAGLPGAVFGSPGFVPPAGGAGAGTATRPGSRPGSGVAAPAELPTTLNPGRSATPRLRPGG